MELHTLNYLENQRTRKVMKQKSIKNIRKEFKDNGIFYTPEKLAEKIKSYVDFEPETVYDPTCGVGNLLKVFHENVKKYGQELDEEQLALIDIPNFTGAAGDTLKDDKFKDMKFDCIVANPPFSVKWDPEELKNDGRFSLLMPYLLVKLYCFLVASAGYSFELAVFYVGDGVAVQGRKSDLVPICRTSMIKIQSTYRFV